MIPRVSCQSDLNIRNIGIIISRVIVAFSHSTLEPAHPCVDQMLLEATAKDGDYCAADDKTSPVTVVVAGEILIG